MISQNIHTVQNTADSASQLSGCCEHTTPVLESPNSSAARTTDSGLGSNLQRINGSNPD